MSVLYNKWHQNWNKLSRVYMLLNIFLNRPSKYRLERILVGYVLLSNATEPIFYAPRIRASRYTKKHYLQPFGIKFVQISNFVEVGQHSKEMGLETSSFFGTLPSTCLNSEDYNSTYDNEDNNRTDSYTYHFLDQGDMSSRLIFPLSARH